MPEHVLLRTRARRWSLAIAFWILVILIATTRLDTSVYVRSLGWTLRASLAFWGVWAALSPLIVAVSRRLPASKDAIGRRLLLHLPLSLLFTAAQLLLTHVATALLAPAVPFPGVDSVSYSPSFPLLAWVWAVRILSGSGIVVYWAIAGSLMAYDYLNHVNARQLKAVELERLLAESRFDTLRTRLHPHVLFNALNAISAHVESDPRTARWILEQFASLLRLSLEHVREPEIPLERELAFVECYLDLQKVRFEDRFEVITKVDPDVLGAFVPTFILQPLVENALRHGVLTRSTPGQIAIKAWRENGSLRLSVRDDGPGLPAGWDPTRAAGEGLSSTRERLHHLYGDDHSLDIAGSAGHGVHVDLTLPLRETGGGSQPTDFAAADSPSVGPTRPLP